MPKSVCVNVFPRYTNNHTCAQAPVCTRDSIRKRPCQGAQRACQVQLELGWPAQFQLVLDAVLGQYFFYAACNQILGLISCAAVVALVCLYPAQANHFAWQTCCFAQQRLPVLNRSMLQPLRPGEREREKEKCRDFDPSARPAPWGRHTACVTFTGNAAIPRHALKREVAT